MAWPLSFFCVARNFCGLVSNVILSSSASGCTLQLLRAAFCLSAQFFLFYVRFAFALLLGSSLPFCFNSYSLFFQFQFLVIEVVKACRRLKCTGSPCSAGGKRLSADAPHRLYTPSVHETFGCISIIMQFP